MEERTIVAKDRYESQAQFLLRAARDVEPSELSDQLIARVLSTIGTQAQWPVLEALRQFFTVAVPIAAAVCIVVTAVVGNPLTELDGSVELLAMISSL